MEGLPKITERSLAYHLAKMGVSFAVPSQNGHPSISDHQHSLEILLNAQRSEKRTILEFQSTHFLRPGRICTVIGSAGAGKSNTVEAIIASHLNPKADTFGLKVICDKTRPFLFIDLERTQDEILERCDFIKWRIHAINNPGLLDEKRFKNVFIYGFLQLPRVEDKLAELQRLIGKYNPYLVILDGSASLVYDVNDTKECVTCKNLLLSLADKHNLSFICTIHSNPGGGNDNKARGVFGSELLRESESVLLLKRAENNRDVRILTTIFTHGKNRSGADDLESYFAWNDQAKMFTSCEYERPRRTGKADSQKVAFTEILAEGRQCSYSGLCKALIKGGYCNSEATAKRWITTAITRDVVVRFNDKYELADR